MSNLERLLTLWSMLLLFPVQATSPETSYLGFYNIFLLTFGPSPNHVLNLFGKYEIELVSKDTNASQISLKFIKKLRITYIHY